MAAMARLSLSLAAPSGTSRPFLVVPAFGFGDGVNGERFELGDEVLRLRSLSNQSVAVELFGS